MKLVKGIWIFESQLYICGTAIKLTIGELLIFKTLYHQPRRIFTRDELSEVRMRSPYFRQKNVRIVDKFISRIKKKITKEVGFTNIIITHYTQGYQLNGDWYNEESPISKAGR